MHGVHFPPAALTQAENIQSLSTFGKVEACEDPRNTDDLDFNPIVVIGRCLSHFEYSFKHLTIPLTCCPISAALLARKPTNCTTLDFFSLPELAAELAWSGQVDYLDWLCQAFATVGEHSLLRGANFSSLRSPPSFLYSDGPKTSFSHSLTTTPDRPTAYSHRLHLI